MQHLPVVIGTEDRPVMCRPMSSPVPSGFSFKMATIKDQALCSFESLTIDELIARATTFEKTFAKVNVKKKVPKGILKKAKDQPLSRQRLRDRKEVRFSAQGNFVSFPRVVKSGDNFYRLTQTADKMSGDFANLAASCGKIGDLAKSLNDGLKSFFGEGSWMNIIVLIGLDIEDLVENFSYKKCAITVFKSLLYLGMDCFKLCKFVYDAIARQVTRAVHLLNAPPERFRTEGLLDTINGVSDSQSFEMLSGVLASAIVVLTGWSIGKKVAPVADSQTVDQLAKKLRNFKSIGTGIEYLIKVSGQMHDLVKWSLARILATKVETRFELLVDDLCSELENSTEEADNEFVRIWEDSKKTFYNDLMKVISVDSHSQIRSNFTWYNKFKRIYAIFSRVQIRLSEGADPSMSGFCRTMFETLGRIDRTVANSPFSPMLRPTPFWFYIYGETRVGKSGTIPSFASYMLHKLHRKYPTYFPTDNMDEAIATLQTSTPYMDNYQGQRWVQIDDIFQRRDNANSESPEALRMIDMITMTKTPIVAAAIENKFRPFEGLFITSTSNVYAPAIKSMAEPAALYARRSHVWEMVTSNNSDRVLSRAKKDMKVVFYRMHPTNGQRLEDTPYTFAQMSKRVFADFCEHFDAQLALVNMVNNREELIRAIDSDDIEEVIDSRSMQNLFKNSEVVPAPKKKTGCRCVCGSSCTCSPCKCPKFKAEGWMDYIMCNHQVPNPYIQADEDMLKDYFSMMLDNFFLIDDRGPLEDVHVWWHEDYVDVGYNDVGQQLRFRLADLRDLARKTIYGDISSEGFEPTHYDCDCPLSEASLWFTSSPYLYTLYHDYFFHQKQFDSFDHLRREFLKKWEYESFTKIPDGWMVNFHVDEGYPDSDVDMEEQRFEAQGVMSAVRNGVLEFCGLDRKYPDYFALTVNPHIDQEFRLDDDCESENRKEIEKFLERYRRLHPQGVVGFDAHTVLRLMEEDSDLTVVQRAKATSSYIASVISENKIVIGLLGAAGVFGVLLAKWLRSKKAKTPTVAQGLKYVTKSVPQRRVPVYRYKAQSGELEDVDLFVNTMERCYTRKNEDNATYDLIRDRFYKTHAIVTVTYKGYTVQATRIGGSYILIPKHFFTVAKHYGLIAGEIFVVKEGLHLDEQQVDSRTYYQKFNPDMLKESSTGDFAIYSVAGMSSAKSMIKQFPDRGVPHNTTHCVVPFLFPTTMIMANLTAQPAGRSEYDLKLSDDVTTTITLPKSYHINMANRAGMCGALALRMDNTVTTKILGMHVAGLPTGMVGLYLPIYRDEIEELISKFSTKDVMIEEAKIDLERFRTEGVKTEPLQFCGVLANKRDYCIPQSKTKIKPSVIHNPDRCVTEPAVLDPRDHRLKEEYRGEPLLWNNMQGYNIDPGQIDTETLRIVEKAFKTEFKIELDTVECKRILTIDEVINGIPGSYKSMEMSTSAGFRYKKMFPQAKGKWGCFYEKSPGSQLLSAIDIVAEDYQKCLELIRTGVRPWMPAYACLKDERRKKVKIENGVTRTFIVMDLIYTMLTRSLFGAFVMAQQAKAGLIPSSVGLDSTKQFTLLWKRLTAVGDKAEDYDYKNWDRSLHPEFIRAYARLVNDWYGDDETTPDGIARIVLMEMLIQTDVIIGNKLFRKNIGICSGCAITAEINCVIHTMLVYYQYIEVAKATGNVGQMDFACFKANVSYCVYGDDIVMVRSDCVDWFNGNNIARVCEELGMTITPADKGSQEFRTKKLTECQFLKRGFVEDPETGAVLAPLELQVITEIPEWIHECPNEVLATQENLETAVRECFFHGEEVFSRVIQDFNDRVAAYNKANSSENRLMGINYDFGLLRRQWLDAGSPLSFMDISR